MRIAAFKRGRRLARILGEIEPAAGRDDDRVDLVEQAQCARAHRKVERQCVAFQRKGHQPVARAEQFQYGEKRRRAET